ncbi:uncharacterized protein [Arachis hypogaea]|uniref:uncharacterized protein n=1 Tax=Arachis hypogaea TaxID=3818 RepID=UPI003B225C41
MANNMGPNIMAFTLTEGQSNNRPPYFNGSIYSYWKERMRIFVQSIDYNIWKIILNGPDVSTKQNSDEEVVAKEDSEWIEEEKNKVELNVKAINLMHYAISFEEYRKVSSMKEDESIDQMFERLSIIINNLDAMGRSYSEETLVRKILRSLTKKWKVKSTAISERNDLIKITYDELRGKLLAYETTHMSQDKDDKKKSKNEKITEIQKQRQRKFFKKDQAKFTCHHCKEPCHFKTDCPQLKKGKKSKKDKKKVMMATWEDLENDTSSENSDQEAQLCLMADHDDEDEVDLSDIYIDELHYIIKDITVTFKKLLDNYVKCKKDNEALRAENDSLLEKVKETEACDENSLKEENNVLRAKLNKFKLKHMVTASTDLIAKNKKLNEQIKNLNEDLARFVQDGLKHNLLSISQLCDLGYAVTFRKSDCRVINEKTGVVLFVAKRSDNVYGLTLDDLKIQNAEPVNTACYVLNQTLIRKFLKKTPYEFWKGHPPNLSYFHVFGCKCFILNIKENLGKFDPKTHESIFLCYSTYSKAYRVYNKNSKTVEKTMHVTFCESNSVPSVCIDDSPGFEAELPRNIESVPQNTSSQDTTPVSSKNIISAGDNLELSLVAVENIDAEAIVDQEEPESSTQTRRPRE